MPNAYVITQQFFLESMDDDARYDVVSLLLRKKQDVLLLFEKEARCSLAFRKKHATNSYFDKEA